MEHSRTKASLSRYKTLEGVGSKPAWRKSCGLFCFGKRKGLKAERGLITLVCIESELDEDELFNEVMTMRQVIIYPGEDGYWVAECPSLPGCISQGRTKAEALTNIKEAIEGYIMALAEDDLPIPEENFEALLVAV